MTNDHIFMGPEQIFSNLMPVVAVFSAMWLYFIARRAGYPVWLALLGAWIHPVTCFVVLLRGPYGATNLLPWVVVSTSGFGFVLFLGNPRWKWPIEKKLEALEGKAAPDSPVQS